MLFIGGTRRTIKNFGWYKGDRFTEWIADLIEKKTGNANITFKELHQLKQEKKYLDLYLTATSLTWQRTVILSHETFPDMKIRDAVRISMSIPLYFQAVLIDENGEILPKPDTLKKYDVLVDGGFIANYPVNLFDDKKYIGDDTGNFFNYQTLGLRLDRENQIVYDREGKGLAPYEVHNFITYIEAMYNMIIENLNRSSLTNEDWNRTISINTMNIGQKVRKISRHQKQMLINSGEAGVRDFFEVKR
jgi:NTE family protein